MGTPTNSVVGTLTNNANVDAKEEPKITIEKLVEDVKKTQVEYVAAVGRLLEALEPKN